LFDTFESFDARDVKVKTDDRLRDTNVDLVLATIGSTENIIVKKGYFPETAARIFSKRILRS
jgi:O-methyltransferase